MYTWGYMKECILAKLNLEEKAANELGFISRFPYYANEAMTQICSSIKPKKLYYEFDVEEKDTTITFPVTFISFTGGYMEYRLPDISNDDGSILIPSPGYMECSTDIVKFYGFNKVICKEIGSYRIPYNARWYTFTKDMENARELDIPLDICDALPSYIASQCYKIDDEYKATILRNEYEMFLARIDDTNITPSISMSIGGNW